MVLDVLFSKMKNEQNRWLDHVLLDKLSRLYHCVLIDESLSGYLLTRRSVFSCLFHLNAVEPTKRIVKNLNQLRGHDENAKEQLHQCLLSGSIETNETKHHFPDPLQWSTHCSPLHSKRSHFLFPGTLPNTQLQ